MSTRSPYTYTVLRYVHDVTLGEFINVGVVISSPECGFIGGKFKSAFSRVKNTFPNVRGDVFKARIQKLQTKFDFLQRQAIDQLRFNSGRKLLEIVHEVLPADDSSLQWSPVGSGLSKDLQATLNSLFERFVTKYDVANQIGRKDDDDVWREFKNVLEQRRLIKNLTSKTIEVDDDAVVFEHAWKNGSWHCYEPISFDLASGNSIKGKAHKWLGQLASLHEANEKFNVYFIVGKPSEPELQSSYSQALSILRKGRDVKVVEENQLEDFSNEVADAMFTHYQSVGH